MRDHADDDGILRRDDRNINEAEVIEARLAILRNLNVVFALPDEAAGSSFECIDVLRRYRDSRSWVVESWGGMWHEESNSEDAERENEPRLSQLGGIWSAVIRWDRAGGVCWKQFGTVTYRSRLC